MGLRPPRAGGQGCSHPRPPATTRAQEGQSSPAQLLPQAMRAGRARCHGRHRASHSDVAVVLQCDMNRSSRVTTDYFTRPEAFAPSASSPTTTDPHTPSGEDACDDSNPLHGTQPVPRGLHGHINLILIPAPCDNDHHSSLIEKETQALRGCQSWEVGEPGLEPRQSASRGCSHTLLCCLSAEHCSPSSPCSVLTYSKSHCFGLQFYEFGQLYTVREPPRQSRFRIISSPKKLPHAVILG